MARTTNISTRLVCYTTGFLRVDASTWSVNCDVKKDWIENETEKLRKVLELNTYGLKAQHRDRRSAYFACVTIYGVLLIQY